MLIDKILKSVIKHEGGFTNNPTDNGGPTKYGITILAYEKFFNISVDPQEIVKTIKAVDVDLALKIYTKNYYLKPNFCALPKELQALVVDTGVLHGTGKTSKWVQKACGAKVDGVIGIKTIRKINQIKEEIIYNKVLSYRIKHYGKIVSHDHSQVVFLNGWLNRALTFLK